MGIGRHFKWSVDTLTVGRFPASVSRWWRTTACRRWCWEAGATPSVTWLAAGHTRPPSFLTRKSATIYLTMVSTGRQIYRARYIWCIINIKIWFKIWISIFSIFMIHFSQFLLKVYMLFTPVKVLQTLLTSCTLYLLFICNLVLTVHHFELFIIPCVAVITIKQYESYILNMYDLHIKYVWFIMFY